MKKIATSQVAKAPSREVADMTKLEESASAQIESPSDSNGSDSALISALRELEMIEKRDPKAWRFPVRIEPFVFVSLIERQASVFRPMFEKEPSMKILELVKGAILELGRRAVNEFDQAAAEVATHCLVQAASVAAIEANAPDYDLSQSDLATSSLRAPMKQQLHARQRVLLRKAATTYPAWPVVLALTSKVPESLPVGSAAKYLKELGVGTRSLLKAGNKGKKEQLKAKQAHVAYKVARSLLVRLSQYARFARLPNPPAENPKLRRLVGRLYPIIGAVPVFLEDPVFGKWCKEALGRTRKAIPTPETQGYFLYLIRDLQCSSNDPTAERKMRFREENDVRELRDLIWTRVEQALCQWRDLRHAELSHAVAKTSKPLRADASLRTALRAMLLLFLPRSGKRP